MSRGRLSIEDQEEPRIWRDEEDQANDGDDDEIWFSTSVDVAAIKSDVSLQLVISRYYSSLTLFLLFQDLLLLILNFNKTSHGRCQWLGKLSKLFLSRCLLFVSECAFLQTLFSFLIQSLSSDLISILFTLNSIPIGLILSVRADMLSYFENRIGLLLLCCFFEF